MPVVLDSEGVVLDVEAVLFAVSGQAEFVVFGSEAGIAGSAVLEQPVGLDAEVGSVAEPGQAVLAEHVVAVLADAELVRGSVAIG